MNKIKEKFLTLKKHAGTHSPSISAIKHHIKDLEIQVDACFLSNPYATELFIEYFNKELLTTKEINKIIEFYPSQNNIIAQLLSEHLTVSHENIFVANGAVEVIQAVLHRFTKGKVIVNIPTFSSYYEYAEGLHEVIYYSLKKENKFQLDVDDYIKFVTETKPDTIVLINPNNPDGGYLNSKDILRVVDELAWVNNILIDESFIHFAYENSMLELSSVVPQLKERDNVIIIKSMSKDFGIAGLRCGYAIMEKSKVSDLLANGYLWNINGIAEYFFRLYTRKDFLLRYEEVRKKYITEAMFFVSEMNRIKGIQVFPTRANFILVEITNGKTANEIAMDLLCDHGVYVRNCEDKIGLDGEFIRIAARSKGENEKIVNALVDVLG